MLIYKLKKYVFVKNKYLWYSNSIEDYTEWGSDTIYESNVTPNFFFKKAKIKGESYFRRSPEKYRSSTDKGYIFKFLNYQ